MSPYGPYGGISDPYQLPEHAGPLDVYKTMLNGQAYLAALDAAENPQYQYVRDPATGQPIRFSDGTPVVERIPMEQRMAPIVRRQQARFLRMKLLTFLAGALFAAYVAVVVYAPAPVGKWLQAEALPVFATVCVWGGAAVAAVWALTHVIRSIVIALSKNAPWKG